LGFQSDEAAAEQLSQAKALVHAAEEDFGLVMAEAQAAGCPVIAYGHGAAREIILDGKTGLLFQEPTVASLMEAVERFEREASSFKQADIVKNARRFGKRRFQEQFSKMVEREWKAFCHRR